MLLKREVSLLVWLAAPSETVRSVEMPRVSRRIVVESSRFVSFVIAGSSRGVFFQIARRLQQDGFALIHRTPGGNFCETTEETPSLFRLSA